MTGHFTFIIKQQHNRFSRLLRFLRQSAAGVVALACCAGMTLPAITAYGSGAVFLSKQSTSDASLELNDKVKEVWVRKVLEEEKSWIKANQGPDGEIYMNRTRQEETGDVNPYFACQAAMGLLAGQVSEEDMASVGEYLTWHSGKILEEDGEVANHKLEDGKLVSTGEYDSTDAYIALFLTLLVRYEEKGGRPFAIPGAKEAVTLCFQKLEELEKDGLTRVSEKNKTVYLMDNAEVYEACRGMGQMLQKNGSLSLSRSFHAMADEIEAGIRARLWDEEEGLYHIGLDSGGKPIAFSGWQNLYPDAIVQIFPVICGLSAGGKREDERLYQEFCRHFSWEKLRLGDTEFPWALIGCAAMKHQDAVRAEAYLRAYSLRYGGSRTYPFYSAEAGWAASTCGRLLEYYKERGNEKN